MSNDIEQKVWNATRPVHLSVGEIVREISSRLLNILMDDKDLIFSYSELIFVI